MNVVIHSILSSALDKGKWTASSTSSFSHRKRATGNHEVGSRAGLGPLEEKNLLLMPGIEQLFSCLCLCLLNTLKTLSKLTLFLQFMDSSSE